VVQEAAVKAVEVMALQFQERQTLAVVVAEEAVTDLLQVVQGEL
jgi:hypothetical protein